MRARVCVCMCVCAYVRVYVRLCVRVWIQRAITCCQCTCSADSHAVDGMKFHTKLVRAANAYCAVLRREGEIVGKANG